MDERKGLPELHSALLDGPTLGALVDDLEALTQIEEVLLKGALCETARAAPLALRAALRELQDGRASGLQVRYRYDGELWWDTLLRTAGGLRLVRIQQAFGQPG